jgi:hypothetical protein
MNDTEELPPHEAAFIAAKAGYELFGEPLKPYSPSRKLAAQTMGCMFPAIGDEAQAHLERTGVYPGVVKDALIVLWLCTLKDAGDLSAEDVKAGAWTPARAMLKPADALNAAIEWAERTEIIDLSTKRTFEALTVFLAIVTAVEASQFTVIDPDASDNDDFPKV